MTDLNLDLKSYDMMKQKGALVPPGDYLVAVDAMDKRQTKNMAGQYLAIRFEILKGEHEGKKVFHQINIEHYNETAAAIGKSELKTLAYMSGFAGYEFIKTTADLIGRQVIVTLDIKQNEGYAPKNIVVEYKKVSMATGSIANDRPKEQEHEPTPF